MPMVRLEKRVIQKKVPFLQGLHLAAAATLHLGQPGDSLEQGPGDALAAGLERKAKRCPAGSGLRPPGRPGCSEKKLRAQLSSVELRPALPECTPLSCPPPQKLSRALPV